MIKSILVAGAILGAAVAFHPSDGTTPEIGPPLQPVKAPVFSEPPGVPGFTPRPDVYPRNVPGDTDCYPDYARVCPSVPADEVPISTPSTEPSSLLRVPGTMLV